MDPFALKVYNPNLEKYRIGRDYDGGYVVCKLPTQYDLLISGGIANDISFEEDFCSQFPNTKCYAYDGTISSIHTNNSNINIVYKNIGPIENNKETNLHSLLNSHSSVFVKMDIEGYEIPWFESLNKNHMNNISQMVVEFHFPFTKRETDIFNKINNTHLLVHFHANNAKGARYINNSIIVPEIFECTYVHKKFIKQPYILNNTPIPSKLDMPNISSKPDIVINHPPFVHSSVSKIKSTVPVIKIGNIRSMIHNKFK